MIAAHQWNAVPVHDANNDVIDAKILDVSPPSTEVEPSTQTEAIVRGQAGKGDAFWEEDDGSEWADAAIDGRPISVLSEAG